MSQFSRKERWIASILSSTPRLKGFIKKVYITVNYIIHRKGYKNLILLQNKKINLIEPLTFNDETFFGYYDKSPENNNGIVIFNETKVDTKRKPTTNYPLWIHTLDLKTKDVKQVGSSFSYTWQQGSRAQWVSETRLVYNFFESGKYKCGLFDLSKSTLIETYDYPVQDSFFEEYYLSINYARIMNLRPDYGYRNLPLLSDAEMRELKNDGIWKVDFASGTGTLIIKLEDLCNLDPLPTFKNALHKVNHVMISPDGKGFIFIHRWYVGLRRYDRLLFYDFNALKVLAAEDMVSHMCWIDCNTVFGYLRHDGKDGFYFINIKTGNYTPCKKLTNLGNGDGHPSSWGNWIVVDTYPDKSRMQHLYLYNRISDKVIPVLKVFQGIKYQGESRCDLHPRFSPDGEKVYFDTVYDGKRRLAFIDIASITTQ